MIKRVLVLSGVLFVSMMFLMVILTQPSWAGGGANVLIDAVYYDSYETNEPDEAVRLRNVSGSTVDLSGWELSDGSSTAVFAGGITIASGETLWLADEAVAFTRQFGFKPDYEVEDTDPSVPQLTSGDSWPGFANGGDEVILRNNGSQVIDCLAYKDYPDSECGVNWSGAPVEPYVVTGVFARDGQILYRKLDQTTGVPVPDTNTAADWAQSTSDVINGRKVLYPGWDLDTFFQTAQVVETAVLTVAIAPDNAYDAVVSQIDSAQTSLRIEAQTFENLGIKDALVAAANRGVAVTVLLEGEPPGGVPDQELYICEALEAAGGACWFMFNESDLDIYDRYKFLHAKFILVDGERVVISSENLSPNSLPGDDKSDGTWGRRGVVLITDAPGVVAHVQSIFDLDFDVTNHRDVTNTAAIGSSPPGFVPDPEWGGVTYTVRYPTPTAFSGNFAFELVQSPENSLRDQDGLLGMVARAGEGDTVLVQQLSERPYWGSTSSNATDDPNPRLEAYIDAARRGADVRLLLDAYFDSASSSTSNAATCTYVNNIALAEDLALACRVGNPTGLGIHNKMVLVEAAGKGYIHVGSLNGTEQSSKGNRELALQVQSDGAYALLAQMFNQDWGYHIHLPVILNNYVAPANYVLISEVLYNPAGLDDKEFVELANPTGSPIDIGNYALGDAVNPGDFEDVRRFPAGTTIGPGQTIVVATAATAFKAEHGVNPDFEIVASDATVPDLIDDPAWGDPGASFQLGNSGDEVILRNGSNQIVDVVTYGSGSYPGVTPCALVVATNASLERFPYSRDTDDCPSDFREWPFPNPGSLP